MHIFNTDTFQNIFSKNQFELNKPGPLYHPIYSISVYQDIKHNIHIQTKSLETAKTNRIDYPPGTVINVADTIELENSLGVKSIIKGVSPSSYNIKDDERGENRIRTEYATAKNVEVYFNEKEKEEYLIEWIDNVNASDFIFPDAFAVDVKGTTLISLGENNEFVIDKDSFKEHSFNRTCMSISVENNVVYFGILPENSKGCMNASGFIIYRQIVSENLRKKIRHSISFAIGRAIVYLGHTIYDVNWNILKLKANSPYDINGSIYNMSTLPPTILSENYQNAIDNKIISSLIASLVDIYDSCDLEHVLWLFWHANCSPPLTSAVCLGACIESLLRTFSRNNKDKVQSTILDKSIWDKLKKDILRTLDNYYKDKSEIKTIINKIESLNQLPVSMQLSKAMEAIGIKLGEIELKSWQQRNIGAHGGKIENDQFIDSIKNTKILKLIFHRILLKISKGSNYYIDYYTIDHPIRNITDNIVL